MNHTKLIHLFLLSYVFVTTGAYAKNMSVELENLRHPELSKVELNPSYLKFEGKNVYKLSLKHGGCGQGDNFNDCENDRQRIEFKSGLTKLSGGFNGPKIVRRYYRTNLYLPNERLLPDLFPMKLMIHQAKLRGKLEPVWKVDYKSGSLVVQTELGEKCIVDSQYLPRDEWLEIEIFADYTTLSSKYNKASAPYFTYAINGEVHCESFSPLITKRALQDAKAAELWVKYGIYNTFASRWLLEQPTNQDWVKANNLTFKEYQQEQKGQSKGAVSSKLGTPFDYDWPVKIPTQTLYYTDWEEVDSLDKLSKSRFARKDTARKSKGEVPSVMDYSVSLAEICGKALAEWNSGGGDWAKAAESRGLTAEGCRLFLK